MSDGVMPFAELRPLENSGSCLNEAAAHSITKMFSLLLERGAKLENAVPLHRAASVPLGERIPMMEYSVRFGVDVDGPDKRGGHTQYGTPLHYAVL
jgi:hypothetical protein